MNYEMKMRKRQILDALDYIDDDLISGVLKKIKPDNAPTEEPVRTWRTPFKHSKLYIVLAACLLLLSLASPVASFITRTISNVTSAAGFFESEFDKELDRFSDMSADEIYEEVIKGSWCVQNMGGCLQYGIDLWFSFLNSVEKGERAKVWFALYNDDAYNPDKYLDLTDDMPQSIIPGIYLAEITFDGEKFTKRIVSCYPHAPDYSVKASEYETKEYSFLYASEDYHNPTENVQFILSNDESVTDEMISKCLLGIDTHLYIDLVDDSSTGPTVSKSDYNNYLSRKG